MITAMAGGRGAVARIDPKADWASRLTAVPVPAVARDVGLADGSGSAQRPGRCGDRLGRWRHRPHPVLRHAVGAAVASEQQFRAAPRNTADVVRPGDVGNGCTAPGGAHHRARRSTPSCRPPLPSARFRKSSGALVAMDPHTGPRARGQRRLQFSRSASSIGPTQAKRQPGSSIKPFVFLTALDHGFHPHRPLIDDAPISLPQGPGAPNVDRRRTTPSEAKR